MGEREEVRLSHYDRTDPNIHICRTFSILVIQNSTGNLTQLFPTSLPTVISQKYSDSYFTPVFRQLLYTNLPTVTKVPTVLVVVNSQLFTYIFHFALELSTRNLKKARGKRLKLLLVAARCDELTVRLESKGCALKIQNVHIKFKRVNSTVVLSAKH